MDRNKGDDKDHKMSIMVTTMPGTYTRMRGLILTWYASFRIHPLRPGFVISMHNLKPTPTLPPIQLSH